MKIWRRKWRKLPDGAYLMEPRAKVQQFKPILIERAKAGDKEAANRLLALAYPYAIRRAKWWTRYFPQLDHMDIAHEGIFGVYDAIRKYDPAKSSFLTYSYIWMDKRMRMWMRKELDSDIPMGDMSVEPQDNGAFFSIFFERKKTAIGIVGSTHWSVGSYADVVRTSSEMETKEVFNDALERAFWTLNSTERELIFKTLISGDETIAAFSRRKKHTRNWGWVIYHKALSKMRDYLEAGEKKDVTFWEPK